VEVVGEERKERFRRGGGRGFEFGEERGFGGGGHYCEKRGLRVRERKGLGKIENEKETVGFVCVFKGRE